MTIHNIRVIGKNVALLLCIMFFTKCKKLIDVSPPVTSITGASVYSSDATASAVVTGMYTSLSNSSLSSSFGLTSLSIYPGLSADELSVYGIDNPEYTIYYTNALSSSNLYYGMYFWNNIYPLIYTVNSALAGIDGSTALTPAIKNQLLGETYFIRAFCYFYLVNLYGDVPLVTTTNYATNSNLPRTSQQKVYQSIVADLKQAQSLLSSNYLDGSILKTTTERTRPTLWAADALLARVYLYTEAWDSAESQASAVIGNAAEYGLSEWDSTFLKNNREAIWQLQPVTAGLNSQEAPLFVLPDSGPSDGYPLYLNPVLVNAFEPGDLRRINWMDSVNSGGVEYYYPYKYKVNTVPSPVTEYEMVLRIGEQFLIRSEARAQQNNLSGAAQDLNAVRARAGLGQTSAATQSDMLKAIYHERQVELFTEWGHRWLDLKRTQLINAIMPSVCAAKGGTWSNDDQLYPIPVTDLKADPLLVQNSGY